jgi:hypothetical protein
MHTGISGSVGSEPLRFRPRLLAVVVAVVVAAACVSGGAQRGAVILKQGKPRALHAAYNQAALKRGALGTEPTFKCFVVDGKPHCAKSATAALEQAEAPLTTTPAPVAMRAITRTRLGEIEDGLARTKSEAEDLLRTGGEVAAQQQAVGDAIAAKVRQMARMVATLRTSESSVVDQLTEKVYSASCSLRPARES